jgi:hypothetical protein
MKLSFLLEIAGVLHLGLLSAGAAMPRAVSLRAHLAGLPPFIRRLFLVYYGFIAMVLVGFGAMTFFCASALADGGTLARALCAFLAIFWTVRLVVAACVFDVRPYLTTRFYRVGYQATNVVFVYLVLVYAFAVWKGGTS